MSDCFCIIFLLSSPINLDSSQAMSFLNFASLIVSPFLLLWNFTGMSCRSCLLLKLVFLFSDIVSLQYFQRPVLENTLLHQQVQWVKDGVFANSVKKCFLNTSDSHSLSFPYTFLDADFFFINITYVELSFVTQI